MTEQEAKTKWCPFTRIGYIGAQASMNRIVGRGDDMDSRCPPATRCIASNCIAWNNGCALIHAHTTEASK